MARSASLQYKLLNYLVCKQFKGDTPLPKRDQPALRFIKIIDPENLDRMFSFEGPRKVFEMFQRFHDKYSDLPSPTLYRQLKKEDPRFKKWLEGLDLEERDEFLEMERQLFKPISDPAYMEQLARNAAGKLMLDQLLEEAKKEIENPQVAVEELLEGIYRAVSEIKGKVVGRTSRREISRIFEKGKKVAFETLSGIKTIFDQIVLMPKGLSVIGAPAKVGKTRLLLNILLDLARRGYHVVIWDLENGIKEMEMRLYKLIMREHMGYTCPDACFFADTWVYKDRISETLGLKEYDPDMMMLVRKGDTFFRVHTWSEQHDDGTGLFRDFYYAEGQVIKATCDMPATDASWEITSLELPEYYSTIQEVIDEELPKFMETITGQIQVHYLESPSTEEIETQIQEIIDKDDDFFVQEDRRVHAIDWMALLEGKGKVWEASRANYAELKRIQKDKKVFTLVIDGVSNDETLYALKVNVGSVNTKGNSQIRNDCVNLNFLAGCPEEQQSRTARLYSANSRWGASGNHVVTYLKTCREYAKIIEIDEDDHEIANPDMYETLRSQEHQGKKGQRNDEQIDYNILGDAA